MDTPQKSSLPQIDRLNRPQVIEEIRRVVQAYPRDDESCACAIASRYGLFCKGFSRYSDEEFRKRFHWIVRMRPGASREELEKVASLYHLGRQEVTGAEICCDVETREHCGCDGWNTFDNEVLENYYQELTGRQVRIS